MIKLRHEQPSLWHAGLVKTSKICGNRGREKERSRPRDKG